MEFKFNHQEEIVHKSIGISEKEYQQTRDKIKKFATECYDKGEPLQRSLILEKVVNELSYSELALIGAMHFQHVIELAIRESQSKQILKDLLDELKK